MLLDQGPSADGRHSFVGAGARSDPSAFSLVERVHRGDVVDGGQTPLPSDADADADAIGTAAATHLDV